MSARVTILSAVSGLLAALAASAAGGEPPNVPLTVSEPAGVARRAEPASGGVPFLPGQVKSVEELALFDGDGRPVPAQFTKLAAYDDGSVQWALVDVVVPELGANGKAEYLVKPGKAAEPKTPLKIEETDDKVVFDTGALSFTVSKTQFSLFDEVTLGGKKLVTGSAVELLNCELGERTMKPEYNRESTVLAMKEGGQVFTCKTGKPSRVKWEYRGPLRATLRVDGDYLGQGPRLSYTTRITAWAGSGAVRVEHSIRNSNPEGGSDAYIQRAAITLKLGFAAKAQAHPAPEPIFVAEKPPAVEPPQPAPEPAAEPAPAPAPATGKKKTGPRPGDFSAKPCDDWCSGGDGACGLMILHRHTGGIYRGPGTYLRKLMGCGWSFSWPGLFVQSADGEQAVVELVSAGPKLEGPGAEQGALGFTPDGTFALADRAHKDSEVWFDFYAGARDAAANAARAGGCRSKLLLVAPGEWYSRTETLGSGHFGTLADEIATYKQWGWTGWDDPKKQPKLPHQPFAFVPKEWIHDVSEDDAVEGYLLQFLRTGERGCFDWAEAYAGFFRAHAIFRGDWGERWGTAAPAGRTNKGMGFGWYGPHYYDWCDSRMHHCHEFGRGVFDYYCLTGSVDALEAGLDLAAEMSAGWERAKPGAPLSLGREFGRKFNTVLRAYQLTRDPQWKRIADAWAEVILKAPNWDAGKNIYLQSMGGWYSYFTREWAEQLPGNKVYIVPQRLLDYLAKNGIKITNEHGEGVGVKGDQKWKVYYLTQVFELSECHQAMERYARVMGSEPMKQRLVDITRGIIKCYWSEKCQFMQDRGYIGWPEPEAAFDAWRWLEAHDRCPAEPGGTHSGYSTRYIADMCARAYGFSGDKSFLDWARKCWNRGSKRLYQQDHQIAGENEVGEFAYIRGAHNDTLLECSARLFYEFPRAK